MSPVARLTTPCFSDLTHIQKALIELVVSHLISREVHILAVGQYVVERLFLWEQNRIMSSGKSTSNSCM